MSIWNTLLKALAGVLTANKQSSEKLLSALQRFTLDIAGIDGLKVDFSPAGKEKKIMILFDVEAFSRSQSNYESIII